VEDHRVRLYVSLHHQFEPIPDTVPGFVFVETDQHVSADV